MTDIEVFQLIGILVFLGMGIYAAYRINRRNFQMKKIK